MPGQTAGREIPHTGSALQVTIASLGAVLLTADMASMRLSLPLAQRGLGMADVDRHWAITACSLACGSLLLIGGRIVDRIGSRSALALGSAGFALAGLFASNASSPGSFVAARAMQGVFSALVAPASLAEAIRLAPTVAARRRALSAYGAIAALGGSIGLILAGAMNEVSSWRACFALEGVLAAILTVATLTVLPRSARQDRWIPSTLDVRGALAACGASAAAILGLGRLMVPGGLASAAALGLTSLLLLGLFFRTERRAATPLLDLGLLDRRRISALAFLHLFALAYAGASFLLSIHLQQTLHLRPSTCALILLSAALGQSLAAAAAGWLIENTGVTQALSGSILFIVAGLALLSSADSFVASRLPIIIGDLLLGLGFGAGTVASITLIMERSEACERGVLGGTKNSVVQLAVAGGVATTNLLYASDIGRRLLPTVAERSSAYSATLVVLAIGVGMLFVAILLIGLPPSRSVKTDGWHAARDF